MGSLSPVAMFTLRMLDFLEADFLGIWWCERDFETGNEVRLSA